MSSLYEEDKKYILNLYNRLNINVKYAEGMYLYDENNNRYLDMYSGIAVNNLGHDKELAEVVCNSVKNYIHLSNYFASEYTVNLAKAIVENTFASKVFFSNSGTEANEAAIKICRKYGKSINEEKKEILSAVNSFHGRTFGSLSLTGQEKYQKGFAPLLDGFDYFNYNDVESLIGKVSDKTCAVFLEIIQGEGGIREVSQEFIDTLVKLSKEYGFLIVIDEIQSGLGRTGNLFAFEKFNLNPDIVTVAKSLGGGLPLGATLVNSKLENVLKPGDHGNTFGGNPVACSAGEYIMNKLINSSLLQSVNEKSEYLIDKLINLKKIYSHIITDIRGRGLMIGMDVGKNVDTIKEKALKKNVLLNSTNNTVIRLLPALTISYKEIDEFLDVFEEVLKGI